MSEQMDMIMPQFAVGIMEMNVGDEIIEVMCLEISTASTQYQCAIATKENYVAVADKLAEGIRRAGAEMKGPRTRLVTNVRELPDGLRRKTA